MKKTILFAAFLLSISYTGLLAQGSFGIRGGLNFSTASMNSAKQSPYTGPSNVGSGGVGFQFGMYGVMDFELFKIQPEVAYSIQKTKFDLGLNAQNPTYNISLIQIPILARYDFVEDKLHVHAGPRFGIPIVSKIEYAGGGSADIKDNTRGFEFSFVIGATGVIPIPDNEVGVTLRYIKGFTDMISEPFSQTPGGVSRYVGNMFQLSASYAFNNSGSNSRRRRR